MNEVTSKPSFVVTKADIEKAMKAVSYALSLTNDHRVEALYRAYNQQAIYADAIQAVFDGYKALNDLLSKMPDEPRWYGVSFGNGNDGVSQSWPSFAVCTNEPYVLARLCLLGQFSYQRKPWANENMEVDGEADYTISATLSEGPNGETEFGAAWMICEVFPMEDDDQEQRRSFLKYDSIEEAARMYGDDDNERASILAVARKEEK
jgi:hypothetical protein